MKKCPVCGVEHSDIVPVCSICGSSLENAETVADPKEPISEPKPVQPAPAAAPASPVSPAFPEPPLNPPEAEDAAKPEQPAAVPDFSVDDIQAAVSSVVSFAVDQEKKGAASAETVDPFDDDSPFVENAMRDKASAKPEQKAQPKKVPAPKKKQTPEKKEPAQPARNRKPAARKPAEQKAAPAREPQQTPQPAVDPLIDTTAVAAASAQKVRAAKENAVAARERNAQNGAPEQTEFDWSERKHKRNQSKSNTPVIAAVCALLALLIVAMIFLIGKMVTGDSGSAQNNGNGDASVTDTENTDGEDADSNSSDTANPDSETQDDTVLPENDPNAEDQSDTGDTTDPDAAAQENQDGDAAQTEDSTDTGDGADSNSADSTGTGEDAQTGDDSQNDSSAEETTQKPELPAITEASETVYATGSVRVRDYPSTEYGAVINGLSTGQSVKRTGTTSTGWSRVEINGAVGYVSSNYLSTSKPDTTSGGDSGSDSSTAYATAGVNVRETPNGAVIGTLGKGQQVTLTGKKEGSWVQIKTGSLTGYVYASYLSSTQSGGSDQGSGSSGDVTLTDTDEVTVYATAGVNVRDYPSSSSGKVIATLTKGQKVTRVGKTSGGWSKIKTGSVTGYVYSSYLSTSKDGGDSGSGGSTKKTGYILPDSNTRNYSKSELSSLSSSQLRLARNEIYARHGRKFSDKSLQDYFNSCSWYSGTVDAATFDANISSYLNSYELANLKLIKELEG